ncbi:tetratricopeptide repeat protein [uncultured Psychroserpens sp.]|uniref:tetratricopeptide repeat protein n=1 Tax=uncultured Psychroserpens sp. TaxID=255436 RepID=UPI00261D41D1|nr:tetratricopeptide repeat protein [uncultured Psychroserpens sp.]
MEKKTKKKSTGKLILKGCLFSILGFIVLMFLIALISVMFFPDKANENFEKAKAEFKSKNYDVALSLINESIKFDSLNINPEYFILKGKIEKSKGDTILFKKDFKIALNSIKNGRIRYDRIKSLYEWSLQQKDTSYSKELLQESLLSFSSKDSINFTNSHLNTYNKYLELKDTIAGIETYKMLCDSIPNGLIFNQIGIYYSNKKKRKKAIEYYKKAIETDTTNGIFYNNLGITYENLKNKKQAIKYYRLGVKYESRDACTNLRNITAKTRYRKIARCWDGTMTYSLGQGACSHHGGIRRYENEPYKEYTMDWNCK